MFLSLEHFYSCHCFVFRASGFEFLTEKTRFSVKHYIAFKKKILGLSILPESLEFVFDYSQILDAQFWILDSAHAIIMFFQDQGTSIRYQPVGT